MIGRFKKSPKTLTVQSPLIRRIVGVHILVLALLGLAFLYIGQYQNELVDREMKLMKTEVNFMASLFGRNNNLMLDLKETGFQSGLAANIIQSVLEREDRQILLFDQAGHMAFDNQTVQQQFSKGERFISVLPQGNILAELVLVAEWLSYLFPSDIARGLPFYRHSFSMNIQAYPDAARTFRDGQSHTSMWRTASNELILTAAAPILYQNQMVGVIYTVRTGQDISAALLSLRWDMMKAFFVAAFLSLFLSYYLSNTIAKPLANLAEAANQVRLSKKRKADIPDYRERMDEIAYLSETLNEMTKALWGRVDAIQDFAADVAHELKNPLTSLKSAIETLMRVEDEEKRGRLLAIIEQDFRRIDLLISDISEASRVDAELSKMTPEIIAIEKFLREIVEMYEAQNNDLSFSFSCSDKTILVEGNPARLAQVFHNIIENAISFSPPRGTVSIAIMGQAEKVEIAIADEGKGIQTTDFDKIFKRFYTERLDQKDFGTHSGLGLSIARQIIEGHNGTLTAENIVNRQGGECRGAKFSIMLPIVQYSKNKTQKKSKGQQV